MKQFLILTSCLLTNVFGEDPWNPPENPDPTVILQEARDDAQNQRYQVALAKQLWYHKHALEFQPAQAGVRLSFALSYWLELARDYPPAKEALLNIRKETAGEINSGKNVRNLFQDYAAINRVLDEPDETVKLFQKLHVKDSNAARNSFLIAKPALIAGKHYELVLHYLDPDRDIAGHIRNYTSGIERAKQREGDSRLRLIDFHNQKLTNEAATLIAILALANEREIAERIAKKARAARDDPDYHSVISEALDGKTPAPFP